MLDSDEEQDMRPRETKMCVVCNNEHELKNKKDEFIDVHCNTLQTPHYASTQCLIVYTNAHKDDFLKLICASCLRLIHPSIGSKIKEIAPTLDKMAEKVGALKIDGFQKYPIPVTLKQKSHNADLYAQCAFDGSLYFDKYRLIKICLNNHFAQPYKLEEQLIQSKTKLNCPTCNQPIMIDTSSATLTQLMSKLQ